MGWKRKRGRPRSPGARQANGRLKRRPSPTPEVLERRRILAGGGDPAKTSTVLDILHTRGIIGDPEFDAGCRYTYCHRVLFGASETPASGGREPSRGTMTDSIYARIETDFGRLSEALGKGPVGRGPVKRMVDAVLIDNQMPRWLKVRIGLIVHQRASDQRDRDTLVQGLHAMAVASGKRPAKAA